jgi:hypothetical protein|tara:strand:- start:141 stop:458 length:318 start_codon:yes stop_codon:yes gene_type:complete
MIFKKIHDDFKKLCSPAFFYMLISVFALIVMMIQNMGNTNTFCLGSYECDVPNTFMIYFLKLLYVLFWTWVLNLMCKGGYKNVAWFFVLLPFVLFFVVLGLYILA